MGGSRDEGLTISSELYNAVDADGCVRCRRVCLMTALQRYWQDTYLQDEKAPQGGTQSTMLQNYKIIFKLSAFCPKKMVFWAKIGETRYKLLPCIVPNPAGNGGKDVAQRERYTGACTGRYMLRVPGGTCPMYRVVHAPCTTLHARGERRISVATMGKRRPRRRLLTRTKRGGG